MNQIVNDQALLFITCIEIGVIIGMFFDIIRILRKLIKHPDFLVQIEDALYWVICALIGFYMLYVNNYGAIRPFVFIGILLGAILYFASFSIVFMKIATLVIKYIKVFISYVIKILRIPINGFINLIKIPLSYVGTKLEIVSYYKKMKLRGLKRRWYHKKAEIRTEMRIRKRKK
ncbi:MAG: Spore cortex biosynthesis protein YabQ-like protein [Clostridia bacterium]|jgi:spore cortex biosynthesis protein YabQ|nr:Spore cortex biosynthesis protein YabQ-like protein [Clostridia bacterium]